MLAMSAGLTAASSGDLASLLAHQGLTSTEKIVLIALSHELETNGSPAGLIERVMSATGLNNPTIRRVIRKFSGRGGLFSKAVVRVETQYGWVNGVRLLPKYDGSLIIAAATSDYQRAKSGRWGAVSPGIYP